MKKLAVETISILIVILFLYAAVSKLMDYSHFKFQLGRSPFITHIAGFVSVFIPAVEVMASVLLLIPATRLYGLYLSCFLMLLFTGYIFAMLKFSTFLPCSCGGVLANMSWNQHLYFNILYTLLSIIGIFLHNRSSVNNKLNKALQLSSQ